MISVETAAKFWERVDIKTSQECWKWKKNIIKNGYGQWAINRRKVSVHRLSFAITNDIDLKEIQDCILHHCDNRSCVNPNHLYNGTLSQNSLDREARNRSNRPLGEKHYRAKLTAVKVLEIRELVKEKSKKELAVMYNVHEEQIRRIALRQSWRHLG